MSGVTREARTLSGADLGRNITLPDGTTGRLRSVGQREEWVFIFTRSYPIYLTIHTPSTPVTIEGTTP